MTELDARDRQPGTTTRVPGRQRGCLHLEVDPELGAQVPDHADGVRPARGTTAPPPPGVLALTGFEAPNPDAHYFGKRALPVDLRDLYGPLIVGGHSHAAARRAGRFGPRPGVGMACFFPAPAGDR